MSSGDRPESSWLTSDETWVDMTKVLSSRPTLPSKKRVRRERTTRGNPFPGSRWFTREDTDVFFGRDAAEIELMSLLRAQRIVLFYAPSGSGKTSLLRAKVLPQLEQRAQFDVLPVVNVHPSVLVGTDFETRSSTCVSVYTAAALLSLDRETDLTGPCRLDTWLVQHRVGIDEYGHPNPTLLVLDQFEQVFETFGGFEQASGRRQFLSQLHDALEANESLRLLIVIREDYLARVELLGKHIATDGFRARYRLGWMTEQEARDAIEKPTAQSLVEFSPELVTRLIEQLAGPDEGLEGERIIPAQLQIVCRRIWSEARKSGRHDEDGKTVAEPDLVNTEAGIEQTMEDHYNAGIDGVASTPWGRWRLRRFFDRLITPARTRQLVPRDERPFNRVQEKSLEDLESVYSLVRSERRAGTPYWELSLDGFVAPVRRSNNRARGVRRRWLLGLGALLLVLGTAAIVSWLIDEDQQPTATITSMTVVGAGDGFETEQMFDGDEGTAIEIKIEEGQEIKIQVTFDEIYELADVLIIPARDLPAPAKAFIVGQRIEVGIGLENQRRQSAYGLASDVTLMLQPHDLDSSISIAEIRFIRR